MATGDSRPTFRLKRVYERPAAADGVRVLVERLWPRGLSKADAAIDRWLKDVAPSHELRRWFGHDPARWHEFRERYRAELAARPEAVRGLRELRELAAAQGGPVTLVFAARDGAHNGAIVLRELLAEGDVPRP